MNKKMLFNEWGGIIPLIALSLVAIFALIALAIDTLLLSSGYTRYSHSADQAAKSALSTFLSSSASTNQLRFTEAVTRAQQVVAENYKSSWLGDLITRANNGDSLTAYAGSNGVHGQVIPGIWYFSCESAAVAGGVCGAPASASACSTSSTFRPCFKDITLAEINTNAPNAIKVVLKTSSTDKLKTIFASVVSGGPKDMEIHSGSTAALLPRYIVFAVDLSRSIVWDTHRPASYAANAGVRPAAYAFMREESSIDCSDFNPDSNISAQSANIIGTRPNPLDSGGEDYDYFNNLPRNPPAIGPRTADQHFKSDYRCLALDTRDPANPASTIKESYLIDKSAFITARNKALDPEPLSSILEGINFALKKLALRNAGGDEVGLVFFDDATDRRFGMLPPIRSNVGLNDFDKMLAATNIETFPADDPAFPNERLINPGRFQYYGIPRYFGSQRDGVDRLPGASDITGALGDSLQMIKNAQGSNQRVQSMVVLFSDGMANCVRNDPFPTIPSAPVTCSNDINDPSFDTYVQVGVQEARDLVTTAFAQSGVTLSFLPIGQAVGPHTLNIKGSNGATSDCMSEHQSVEGGISFVNAVGGSFNGGGTNFVTNSFWNETSSLGGVYQPLRKCCDPNCADVTATLSAQCSASSVAAGQIVTSCPATCVFPYDTPTTCNTCKIIDAQGRLMCDPKGFTAPAYDSVNQKQVTEAINKILDNSPIVLVDDKI